LGTKPKERKIECFCPDNSVSINTRIFIISRNFTPPGRARGEGVGRLLKPELVY
jgi:hypothetical protein